MKKTYFFLALISTVFIFEGCNHTVNNEQEAESSILSIQQYEKADKPEKITDIREIAYKQLPQRDKEKIAGTWQDFKLSKEILKEYMGIINDKSYIGKEVYAVDIKTTSKAIPNNMIVFMSTDNEKLIGYGIVD